MKAKGIAAKKSKETCDREAKKAREEEKQRALREAEIKKRERAR